MSLPAAILRSSFLYFVSYSIHMDSVVLPVVRTVIRIHGQCCVTGSSYCNSYTWK